jgi:tRNA(fMet)-specific endonuclease VapC
LNPLRAKLLAAPLAGLCISSMAEAELLYGLARRPEATALKTAVQAFMHHVDVLPWDGAAAAAYGSLRAALEKQGTPLGNLDTLIAAHALATGSVPVTSDKALKRTPGLMTADWTVA